MLTAQRGRYSTDTPQVHQERLEKGWKIDIVSPGICVLFKTVFSFNMLSIVGKKKFNFYQRLGTRKKFKLHLWISWVIKLTEYSILHSYSNAWKHLSGTLFMQWCLNLSQEKCISNPSFWYFINFFSFFLHWWEMIQRTEIPFWNISSSGDLGAARLIKLGTQKFLSPADMFFQSAINWKPFTMSKFSFITRGSPQEI